LADAPNRQSARRKSRIIDTGNSLFCAEARLLDGTIYSASWVENALPGATVTLVFAGPTGNSSTHSAQRVNNSLAELAFQENLTPAVYPVAPRGVLGNVGPKSVSMEVDWPPLSRDGPSPG
jgi:hypothetical protein